MTTKPVERFPLPAFLILTPLLSLGIALFLPLPVEIIALLMVLIPVTLPILLTALAEGGKGVAELFKKLFRWRVSLKWYALAAGTPLAIILICSLLGYLIGWSPSVTFHIPEPAMLITATIVSLLAAVFEEFGWRGYALPRLLKHRSALVSALLIGIAWGLLHIGLGLRDNRPWLPTFLAPVAISVVLTWLFVQTRGSLTMAVLYHFVIDASPQFLLHGITTAQNIWLQVIVSFAAAFILILIFGVNLRNESVQSFAVSAPGKID